MNIGIIVYIIGALIAGFSSVGSIGYGLYLWGSVGLASKIAAWTAFKVWLVWLFGGLIVLFFGMCLIYLSKRQP